MKKENLKVIKENSIRYLDNLQFDKYIFSSNLTSEYESYKLPRLGNSCYAIKLKILLNEWDKIKSNDQQKWINYLTSFQNHNYLNYETHFVDQVIYNYYQDQKSAYKDAIKKSLNFLTNSNYKPNNLKLNESINAETKQAVSTIYDSGFENTIKIKEAYKDDDLLIQYLDGLNWSYPWNSGGQYASLCVYSKTQGYKKEQILENYILKLIDSKTGAYFRNKPSSSREIINGAMKIISGLNWINVPVHKPKELIDFCLKNKPDAEGCDIVDYVFVLYSCAMQTNYNRKDIAITLEEIFQFLIDKLYKTNEGGFSYFINKTQTHYYGLPVSKGENKADLHGTLLCIWAISMIEKIIFQDSEYFNLINP